MGNYFNFNNPHTEMTTYAYSGVLQGTTTTINMWLGVGMNSTTDFDLWVYNPKSHTTCFTLGANTTLGTTTDAWCLHTPTTGMAVIGDYYGVSSGTLTADTTNNWTEQTADSGAWLGYHAMFRRTLAGDGSKDYALTAGTAFTPVDGSCTVTLTSATSSTIASCTGFSDTTAGAMSMVAPFAALAYVVAALF